MTLLFYITNNACLKNYFQTGILLLSIQIKTYAL